MDLFNRALVVFLLLGIIVLTAVLMVVPAAALQLTAQALNALAPLVTFETQLVLVVIGVFVLVIAFLLLWLELRSPTRRSVRIAQVQGGEAEMTTDAISQRLAYNVDKLADVVRVQPRVFPRSKGVDIKLDVETAPDVEVPAKTEEIIRVVREVVEQRMGLTLGKIRVNIKHAPYAKGASPSEKKLQKPV